MKTNHITASDHFHIGGEELLASVAAESCLAGSEMEKDPAGLKRAASPLEEIRVRVGTLLKTETVSLLLGAGASVDCGGELIGSVPLRVEQNLTNEGVTETQRPRIRRWLMIFYLAIRQAGDDVSTPVDLPPKLGPSRK